jgi:L-ascorbate metabolism protein UlaG (beta-lactamase superfamily)
MDETTLTAIAQKFPNAKFLAGLRSEEILQGWAAPTNTFNTAGWYQRFALPDDRVKIFFVPARHWSRRGLFDTNHRLWGGYVIQSDKATIYHGGDSGFGSHYREAGEVFPDIDYFLIGIGAYEPRWFMHPNHNTPEEAVQAFIDCRAKTLVPMHYGRFNMSDEPPSQPLRHFQQEVERRDLTNRTKILAINDNIVIE